MADDPSPPDTEAEADPDEGAPGDPDPDEEIPDGAAPDEEPSSEKSSGEASSDEESHGETDADGESHREADPDEESRGETAVEPAGAGSPAPDDALDEPETNDVDGTGPDGVAVGAASPGNDGGAPEAPGSAAGQAGAGAAVGEDAPGVPEDVRKYARFKKVDGAQYDRVNEFLRERTYVTAREWAIARLCADFRTETGVEMTKIGENLPELIPFMEDTYSPQAVNQARSSFEEKVTKAGATFLYGAMCDFFTAEGLDELMYEVTEVAKFLLEVEGIDLAVEEELEAEDRISGVMREVRTASEALRYEECPHCGEQLQE